MAIRILLVDDHHLFRQGLRRIIESQPGLEVVAEAASGLEAIQIAKQHQRRRGAGGHRHEGTERH